MIDLHPLTTMSQNSIENQQALIHILITEIALLSRALPASVRQAVDRNKIPIVSSSDEGETPWHTFNKRFDALFAEDCRDNAGRLHHIRRGPLGMELVAKYLEGLNGDELHSMPVDLVINKLNRLSEELNHLV